MTTTAKRSAVAASCGIQRGTSATMLRCTGLPAASDLVVLRAKANDTRASPAPCRALSAKAISKGFANNELRQTAREVVFEEHSLN